MKIGDLVAVKEVPGTKQASKRKPLWGVITDMHSYFTSDRPELQTVRVELLDGKVKPTLRHVYGQTFIYLQKRCLDLPPERQIPEHIKAEFAKRVLLGEIEA